MTPKQQTLVTGTSDVLLSVDLQVADAFYDALFARAPDARAFFKPDLSEQKLKLASMLASLVGSINHPQMFMSILQRAARDHARLGIRPHHYDCAGEALLKALETSLGPRFTPEVRDAWLALYGTIQHEMLTAAR